MSAVSIVCEMCPFLAEEAAPAPQMRSGLPRSAPYWRTADSESKRAAMFQAYDRTGGLVRSDELLFMLRRRTSQPLSMLARWIVERRVLSFEWQAQRFVPMFQFDRADMSIRRSAASVLLELSGTFDEWELATWFAEPNAWLQGRLPVEALAFEPQAVVDATRADRFVARG